MTRLPRRPHPAAALLLLLLIPGCSNPLRPGDTLTGRYSSDFAVLTATNHGATFAEGCLNATLPKLELDGFLDFSVQSTALTLLGNIQHTGDEVLTLTGHQEGNQLFISVVVRSPSGPAVDPIGMTLQHNGPSPNLICPA